MSNFYNSVGLVFYATWEAFKTKSLDHSSNYASVSLSTLQTVKLYSTQIVLRHRVNNLTQVVF